jgi:acetoin utilization protein AcuB
MQAKEIMSSGVYQVNISQNFNVVEVLADIRHIRHIVVVNDNEELAGIVSVRDLLEHLSVASASRFAPIKDIMSKNVISTGPETELKQLARLLVDNQIGCLPIVENKKVVGIVSERDLVRQFALQR